jgi:hypothetical protein
MRKVQAVAALGAAATLAVAAATGASAQGPARIHGKVAVYATPTNTTDPNTSKTTTSSVEVTGKLKTQGVCLGGRKVEFIYVTPAGTQVLSETAISARNGKFSVRLPAPTGITSKQSGTAITLSATAAQVGRKDRSTGQKVRCLEANGITDFIDLT